MYLKSNDGSQNTFVYQPTLDTLELKKGKGTDYTLSWKSKGVHNSKFKPLYTAFIHKIKLSGYTIGIKFNKRSFSCRIKQLLEQNCKYLYCLLFRCLTKKSY